MSYGRNRSYCDNERDHQREGEKDFDNRGRYGYDSQRYQNHVDACDEAYTKGFDSARREDDRRQEMREEEEAQERQEMMRHRERDEMEQEQEQQREQEMYERDFDAMAEQKEKEAAHEGPGCGHEDL